MTAAPAASHAKPAPDPPGCSSYTQKTPSQNEEPPSYKCPDLRPRKPASEHSHNEISECMSMHGDVIHTG